jgi:AraC-like DNA-binding protein
MPIYMDVHIVPGVKAKDVAEAHRKDLLHQHDFGCNCMTYWIDEKRESIFCLIDAPDKDAVEEMHSKAHGLIPNKIIEVSSKVVESFLGRIYDPQEAKISEEGLKVFSDASLRILLVTTVADPVLLESRLGKEKANELLQKLNKIVRTNINEFGGSEAEHRGAGFIVSFISTLKALSCAIAIQKDVPPNIANECELKIALNAGEPVARSTQLFGDTIQLAMALCTVNKDRLIGITSTVKELVAKDNFHTTAEEFFTLPPQEESLLNSMVNTLEENWEKPEFNLDDFSRAMAMSTSQLYRVTVKLTAYSPNILLKEFRLAKAKEMMKQKRYSISQITFDSGFTSPSYFTKCFKKKYGLLPMEYLDLLH